MGKSKKEVLWQWSSRTVQKKGQDGSILVMLLDDLDGFYAINGLAKQVWMKFKGASSIESVASTILKKHKPPEKLFVRDMNKFIKDLQKRKLIERA